MSVAHSIFRWFERDDEMLAYAETLRRLLVPIEELISASASFSGYCPCCEQPTEFTVNSGVMLGTGPNLREGLVCTRCGLSNRNRLVYTAVREVVASYPEPKMAILECLSPLFRQLKLVLPEIQGSEFLGRDVAPGAMHEAAGGTVRNESITNLSHPTASLDVICHNDVLEHVYDTRAALRECRRVLRAGGVLLFTCPFLMYRTDIATRATEQADGTVVHHETPEYHGDPVRAEGALTFHHFGWQLLQECRDAGFADAHCGVLYDPFLGFTSSPSSRLAVRRHAAADVSGARLTPGARQR